MHDRVLSRQATLVLAAALVLAATDAFAAKTIIRRGYLVETPANLPCTVRVDFESRGAGPDLDAFARFQRYVIDTEDVDQADAWGWGRDGEFSLCLTIYDPAAAGRIVPEIERIALAVRDETGAVRGPVTVQRGPGPLR